MRLFPATIIVLTAAALYAQVPIPAEMRGAAGGGLHLYPLGWSSEGRWGAVIGQDSGTLRIIVIDAVTDEILYESQDISWPGSLDEFWQKKANIVIDIMEYYRLETNRRPDVRDPQFTTGGVRYTFALNPSSPAAGSYSLTFSSSRGDSKTVYTSPNASAPQQTWLLGALVSPLEERALAILREQSSAGKFRYRFSGAHLTQGFAGSRSGTGSYKSVEKGNLLTAVFNGQEYLVQSRLADGANPNMKDKRGYPMILIAARLGHWRILSDLLAAGAQPNPQDANGRSPLHHAAFAGSADAVRALLAAGANPSLRDSAGRTPAELAADEGIRSLLR
ncbi:MAG: hypothetical protein B0D92_03275 [Spirochaeta sp. LUC14_002_19_P3]|nr:MAG: hypothetical protein B0D92_03275 [Spirochaeta sp. LUC14_002_19_P3]